MGRREINKLSPQLVWETSAIAYVCPNIFRITGTPVLAYIRGSLVYVPGGGWASVQAADSGDSPYIYLSDAICFPGMCGVALQIPTAGLVNIGPSGTPLSGGDLSGWPASSAFDGVLHAAGTTCWVSSQSGTGVSGVAWLGCQFATAKSIKWFRVLQNDAITPADISGYIASVLFQYSDSGSSWNTVGTYTLRPDIFHFVATPIPTSAHVYWRILANANPAAKWWGVTELEMGE